MIKVLFVDPQDVVSFETTRQNLLDMFDLAQRVGPEEDTDGYFRLFEKMVFGSTLLTGEHKVLLQAVIFISRSFRGAPADHAAEMRQHVNNDATFFFSTGQDGLSVTFASGTLEDFETEMAIHQQMSVVAGRA